MLSVSSGFVNAVLQQQLFSHCACVMVASVTFDLLLGFFAESASIATSACAKAKLCVTL